MRPAPIISINLWFDRRVTEREFAGLRGSTIQWLFNKGRILRRAENSLALVVSGVHRHVDRLKEELVAVAPRELRTFCLRSSTPV